MPLLRPLLGPSKSGLISGVVPILNTKYSKCPKVSNTLFHIFGHTFAFMRSLRILNGMANCANPDQTAPIWVYTVCICHFVRHLRKHMGLTKAGRDSGVVVISSGRNSENLL